MDVQHLRQHLGTCDKDHGVCFRRARRLLDCKGQFYPPVKNSAGVVAAAAAELLAAPSLSPKVSSVRQLCLGVLCWKFISPLSWIPRMLAFSMYTLTVSNSHMFALTLSIRVRIITNRFHFLRTRTCPNYYWGIKWILTRVGITCVCVCVLDRSYLDVLYILGRMLVSYRNHQGFHYLARSDQCQC